MAIIFVTVYGFTHDILSMSSKLSLKINEFYILVGLENEENKNS